MNDLYKAYSFSKEHSEIHIRSDDTVNFNINNLR